MDSTVPLEECMKASHTRFALRLSAVALLSCAVAFTVLAAQTSDKKTSAKAPAASSGAKVDLNTASEKDLEDLPGVGAATAKKIVAGRPYSSVDDLSKAGLSARVIAKLAPMATVSGGSAAAAAPKAASAPKASKAPEASSASSGAPVDLNKASEKELEDLPGVGTATAKKIIAGRPYSSVDDLSKAGLSARVIAKLAPMATVSGGSAAAATSAPKASTKSMPPAAPSAPASAPAAPPAAAKSAPASSASQGSPGPGLFWVIWTSGFSPSPGPPYTGKPRGGNFYPEAAALKRVITRLRM